MLNRRGFLRAMVGGIAVAAAERTFPFRVFSFPKKIITNYDEMLLTPVAFMIPISYTQLVDLTWYAHPTQCEAYEELGYALPQNS